MKATEENWPPATGSYEEYGPRCRHKTKPAEPFAQLRAYGEILRVTPAVNGVPAQAFVQWEGYETWEKLTALVPA